MTHPDELEYGSKSRALVTHKDYSHNQSDNNFNYDDYNYDISAIGNDNNHQGKYYRDKELRLRELLLLIDKDEVERFIDAKKREFDQIIGTEMQEIRQKLNDKINEVHVERESVNNAGVSGLKNLGNTCYLNSTLQCLNNIPFFNIFMCQGGFAPSLDNYLYKRVIEEIEKQEKEKENIDNKISTTGTLYMDKDILNHKKEQLEKQSICINLSNVLRVLWQKNKLIVPKSFRESIKKFGELFEKNDQNDSHEFVLKIFNAIHDETVHSDPIVAKNTANKFQQCKTLFGDNIPFKSCYDEICEYWTNYQGKNISIITELFTMITSTIIKCHNCNRYKIRYETENYLTLQFPEQADPIDLSELLKNWSAKEYLNGDNKYDCTPCKSLQNAEKFNNVILPPKTLVIQLGRFQFGEDDKGNLVKNKIKTKINFPIRGLKLNDTYFSNYNMSFVHNDTPSVVNRDVYDLCGVIEHQGSTLNCGHYVCYCKNFENGKWYKFNDNHIHHIRDEDLATINNEGSYVLFYALQQQ